VSKDLGRRWTLGELAEIGIVSEEHLRRLCKKQLGRSPMQYLIYLRMMEARNLLIPLKLGLVFAQVVYDHREILIGQYSFL